MKLRWGKEKMESCYDCPSIWLDWSNGEGKCGENILIGNVEVYKYRPPHCPKKYFPKEAETSEA